MSVRRLDSPKLVFKLLSVLCSRVLRVGCEWLMHPIGLYSLSYLFNPKLERLVNILRLQNLQERGPNDFWVSVYMGNCHLSPLIRGEAPAFKPTRPVLARWALPRVRPIFSVGFPERFLDWRPIDCWTIQTIACGQADLCFVCFPSFTVDGLKIVNLSLVVDLLHLVTKLYAVTICPFRDWHSLHYILDKVRWVDHNAKDWLVIWRSDSCLCKSNLCFQFKHIIIHITSQKFNLLKP